MQEFSHRTTMWSVLITSGSKQLKTLNVNGYLFKRHLHTTPNPIHATNTPHFAYVDQKSSAINPLFFKISIMWIKGTITSYSPLKTVENDRPARVCSPQASQSSC